MTIETVKAVIAHSPSLRFALGTALVLATLWIVDRILATGSK